MVRRWSYINSLNIYHNPEFERHRQATFGVTIKATMYYRKPYSVPTALTRSRWARRRHLNGWLVMANVLKDWAQSYRFHKNYTKATLRQNFTKSSFIAFNLVSLRNSIPCLHKGSEDILMSSAPRRILRYFATAGSPRMRNLLSFKNSNLAFMSTKSQYWDVEKEIENNYSLPFFTDGITSMSHPTFAQPSTTAASLSVLTTIFAVQFTATLKTLEFIYRTLTLLTLTRTKL